MASTRNDGDRLLDGTFPRDPLSELSTEERNESIEAVRKILGPPVVRVVFPATQPELPSASSMPVGYFAELRLVLADSAERAVQAASHTPTSK